MTIAEILVIYHAREFLKAADKNSGYEPSISVAERAQERLRDAFRDFDEQQKKEAVT